MGDDVTLVALNFEFTYRLPPAALRARSRCGSCMSVAAPPSTSSFSNDTQSEGGFSGLVGLAHRNGLFAKPSSARSRVPTSSLRSATRFIRETAAPTPFEAGCRFRDILRAAELNPTAGKGER